MVVVGGVRVTELGIQHRELEKSVMAPAGARGALISPAGEEGKKEESLLVASYCRFGSLLNI